jgi:hypothetical protein
VRAIFFIVSLAGLAAGCEHVETVDRIPQIAAVIHAPTDLLQADEVRFVLANHGRAMHLVASTGTPSLNPHVLPERRDPITAIVLKPGESFTLADGYHVSITYTLGKITEERITLKETTIHRPPDKPRSEKRVRRIIVSPYSTV